MPKYEMYVYGSGFENKPSAVAGSSGEEKTYAQKTASSLEKGVKGLVTYSAVKGTAERLIQTEIGRVELATGAKEYQQRLQQAYGIGSFIANNTISVAVGFVTGNAPLALIGVATSILGGALEGFQKQRTLRLEEANENISIGLAARRASTNGRRQ